MAAVTCDRFDLLLGERRGREYAPARDQLVCPEDAGRDPINLENIRPALARLRRADALAPSRLHDHEGRQLFIVLDGPPLSADDGSVHRFNIGYDVSASPLKTAPWVIYTHHRPRQRPTVVSADWCQRLANALVKAGEASRALVRSGDAAWTPQTEPSAVVYHEEWFLRAFAANISAWPVR